MFTFVKDPAADVLGVGSDSNKLRTNIDPLGSNHRHFITRPADGVTHWVAKYGFNGSGYEKVLLGDPACPDRIGAVAMMIILQDDPEYLTKPDPPWHRIRGLAWSTQDLKDPEQIGLTWICASSAPPELKVEVLKEWILTGSAHVRGDSLEVFGLPTRYQPDDEVQVLLAAWDEATKGNN